MPGDRWQKLANLRALYAYMWAHPGKKLLFMGGEFAQEQRVEPRALARLAPAREPRARRHPDARPRPQPRLPRRARRCGRSTTSSRGFHWLEPNDAANNVVAFCRVGEDPVRERRRRRLQPLAGAARGLPPRAAAGRPLARGRQHRRRASTAARNVGNLGGVDAEETGWSGQPFSAELTLPPLGVVWLVPER